MHIKLRHTVDKGEQNLQKKYVWVSFISKKDVFRWHVYGILRYIYIYIYSMSQLDMQVGYSLISEKIKVTNPGPNYHLSLISRYK